jgi:dihydroorotate dehydrogenase
MYESLKSLLFRLDAETAHGLGHRALGFAEHFSPLRKASEARFVRRDPALESQLWGLHFPNPVGLAAGFDKDGEHPRALAALGFGFVELGTVTAHPQPGNPPPRLFRLPQDEALLNRMGFNNHGAAALAARLSGKKVSVCIGVNLGKSKVTANEDAAADYLQSLDAVYAVADYLVVNVSSPNTPGLRQLQAKEPLRKLLHTLRERMNAMGGNAKPLLLKLAPDLSDAELDDILELLGASPVDGLIATNTTLSREQLKTSPDVVTALGAGGISGLPVRARSTQVIRRLYQGTQGKVPIIGVGGIFSGADAVEKMKAGASLVQIYTSFIYGGPGTVARILDEMLAILKQEGRSSVSEWIGTA